MDDTVKMPIASPAIVLREEFDDWAILYDSDTGDAFGINPVGVMIWKLMDGTRTRQDIAGELRTMYEGIPENLENDVGEFLADLEKRGLIGKEIPGNA